MSRYVQSMYYRDWVMSYRIGMNIQGGQTTTIQVPLYTASLAPIQSLGDIFRLDLYLFVQSTVPMRLGYGGVSQDAYRTPAMVHLSIPGGSLPSDIVPYFGNSSQGYYLFPVQVTNLSSSNGRFSIPHYEALVDYRSENHPNPYYHGTDPESSGYIMPGDAFWSTRFVYRGRRSAFPFVTLSQCTGQALARTEVSMMVPPVSLLPTSGVTFSQLVRALNRLNRILLRDGVMGGV